MVHFHARDAAGVETSDPDAFRQIIAGLRVRSDLLIHATLGPFLNDAGPDERTAHLRVLAEDHDLRPDFGPLDLGSVNLDFWDRASAHFRVDHLVYRNRTVDLRDMARRFRGWGFAPQTAIWNVSGLRLLEALIRVGELATPVYASLFLCGDAFLAGHPATSAGLDAYLSFIPEGVEWTAATVGASALPLLEEVVRRGGHVSIGIGDYTYPELGRPSNANLVRRVCAVAAAAGREVATPAEARAMLCSGG